MDWKSLEFIKSGKLLFIVSVAVNFAVYFLGNVVPRMQNPMIGGPIDFYSVFMKTAEIFIERPANIYFDTDHTLYRNLPAHMLYLVIFHYIGGQHALNLFSHSLIIFYVNLGSCYLISSICQLECMQERATILIKRPFFLMAAYMLLLMHGLEYLFGHSHAQAGFFALLGIYYYLQGRKHLAVMSWSIAAIFKLNPLLWVFFFIWELPWKKLMKNMMYAAIPQIPSIIMFLTWPKLITDFFNSNVHFSTEWAPLVYPVSGTVSRELSYLFSTDIVPFAVATLCMVAPLTIYIVYKFNLDKMDKLMIVALSTIAILPDFTTAHVFYIAGLFLTWLSVRSSLISNREKIALSIILGIPTLATTPWFYFPFISPFYVIPLGYILIKVLKPGSREHHGN